VEASLISAEIERSKHGSLEERMNAVVDNQVTRDFELLGPPRVAGAE
jgi:hypothetical protein